MEPSDPPSLSTVPLVGVAVNAALATFASACAMLASLALPAAVPSVARASHPGDAMAIVVLPPQVPLERHEQVAVAAELLREQLASDLGKQAGLSVVDRSQLASLLAERSINADTIGPMTAYDAMVRIRVDLLRAEPSVTLEAIDLSSGNVIGTSDWPWAEKTPVDRLRRMAETCAREIRAGPGLRQGVARLRFLGLSTEGQLGRLEPLRRELEQILIRATETCPDVCVVHHIEAASAAEESLLLGLGLARLSGERAFAPQADMMLEARLRETDSKGKTFEDTTVEIGLRLSVGNDAGEWKTVSGKVAEWSTIVPKACALSAGLLGQARPTDAAKVAEDFILRRAQAKAELQAAMNEKDKNDKPAFDRVAAAVKIDPSYEPAVSWLVECCHWQEKGDAIREALRYLERFQDVPKNRQRVVEIAYYATRKTIPDAEHTCMLRSIIDIAMSDIEAYDPYAGWLVGPVYQGMKAGGVSAAARMAWLEQVRGHIERLVPQLPEVEDFHRDNVESSFLRVRHFLVAFALDCGQPQYARKRLAEFMACEQPVARDAWAVAKREMRPTVAGMGDRTLLAEYDRWLAALTTPVRQIELEWVDYKTYDQPVAFDPGRQLAGLMPLASGGGKVYGVTGTSVREMKGWADRSPSRQKLACVAAGESDMAIGMVTMLTLPEFNADVAVTGMAFVAGRLYVSTKRTGLLVYDPAAGSWRQIGPDQGLMDWNVCHINAIDDTTLLVVSSDGDRRIVYGTLDVTTGKTTLLHHHLETPMGGARYPVMAPTCTWPTGKQWIAMNYTGLARDILRKQPEFERWPDVWPHGWKCRPFTRSCEPTSIATVGKRRYVMAGTGLHEIDANADVIRTWANRMSFSAGGPDRDNLARDDITTPADFPVDDLRTCYSYLSASEDRLFLFAENGAVLCYEPESDTWLGPLSLPESYDGISALGDNNGVWVGGASHLSYVRAADFAAAARAAGRTMTSADVRRHKREHAEKAGGLEAARFDLLMRNFDSAKERTQAVLDADPANTQALLTMAVLHDFWCLNRPEEAMKWYGRLAKLQDDKSAVFTGLYGVFRITYTLERYDQAIAAGNRLLDEVPCMYAHMRHTVERFMTYARRNMAKAQPVD